MPNPGNFPQGDPCARINAAIGSLPTAGGTVDARDFAPGQVCNTTITANKPVTLMFGAGTWTLNANPGINVSAPNVILECPASTFLQTSPTTLMSGTAAPLIANYADEVVNNGNFHTADGTQILNCALDGGGVGTFGIFAPAVYSMRMHGLHVRAFTAANIFTIAAQNDMYNTVSDTSGGDGVVWGADGHISGMSQSNGNAGDGWHVVSGGNVLDAPTAYENKLYGMHFDGNEGGDWVASHTYLEPKIIQPVTNNAGGYAYYTQAVGTSSATRPAQFCQSVGCLTRDGGVTWINVGNGNLYGLGLAEFYASADNINSPNVAASNFGNNSGDWDGIFIEGTATKWAEQISLNGAKPDQAAIPSYPTHGIHLKFVANSTVSDTQWLGGAWNPPLAAQPDLGGVAVEDSNLVDIHSLNCSQSYGPCLVVTGSSDVMVSKIAAANGGVAASTAPYVAQIDGASSVVLMDGVEATDSRTPPYQHGVANSGTHVTVKNEKYQNVAANDSGVQVSEAMGLSDSMYYSVPGASSFQWAVGGLAIAAFNGQGVQWFSAANAADSVTTSAPGTQFSSYQMTWPASAGSVGQCLTSAGGGTTPMTWSTCSNVTLSSPPPIGNVTPNTVSATALTYQTVPGVSLLVSHYGSLQAAINAAYGTGTVGGTVIDDRTAAYTGPGFNVPDSVTVVLAPVTYTINATVTYNNGNNNVTAGIIVEPGARLLGASTSTNHGTIVQPANGLNADLIATSTEGTGTTSPQWWHWGELGNLRIVGNGANQTAGDCVKIENMGETARVHDIELSACYANNIEFIGYSATQSAVSNITSNKAVNGAGVAFTNLSGVAVLNGFSGDCNQVALINANFNAAGTLDIHGLKAEAESSICPSQVQDPVILISETAGTVPASVNLSGGYAFGTSQSNFVKNAGPGTAQLTYANFYLNGYTNILTDTVRSAVIANAATTTKQPVSYLSNGIVFGNQAFTFMPNTYMQGNPNGTPTEMLGAGSDSSTDIAAIGDGDNSSYFAGGIKFGTFNRTTFGQTPEYQARMGWRWTNPGYDTNTWTFVPIRATGDTSVRWIGDPNARWPEVYAADVNSTTATVGTLTVSTCNGCGAPQVNSDWNANSGVAQILNKPSLATVATSGSYNDLNNKPVIPAQGAHLVSGSMQAATATLTGNSADQTIYSASLPAGSFAVGTGVHCYAKWTHPTASGAITYKWTLGTTTWAYGAYTSSSLNASSDIEILTVSSLSAQAVNLSPVVAGTAIGIGGSYGNAGSENLANADTIKLTFNGGASDQIKGATFYCQTIQ